MKRIQALRTHEEGLCTIYAVIGARGALELVVFAPWSGEEAEVTLHAHARGRGPDSLCDLTCEVLGAGSCHEVPLCPGEEATLGRIAEAESCGASREEAIWGALAEALVANDLADDEPFEGEPEDVSVPRRSPEEKLLDAIFGSPPPPAPEDEDRPRA